jgi:hypothetical protein
LEAAQQGDRSVVVLIVKNIDRNQIERQGAGILVACLCSDAFGLECEAEAFNKREIGSGEDSSQGASLRCLTDRA